MGTLKPHAASVLMKILYMARMARYDLLKATCKLATHITRWDALCDIRLKRLVEYLDSTRSYRLMGWIGDRANQIIPCLWTDADLAGCPKTQRSTSGVHLALKGPHSSFPLNGICKRQGSISHATAESEIIAANFGLRTELEF